jgi:Zn-dependent protease with chaperone function
MSAAGLKAILAHEYGHFTNRDTAGGDLALHVRSSLLRSAEAMAAGGAAGWYNPAWLFLNGFYKIYLRVSHGASRLQEVLADRWAAVTYGARAFADGLRHVVRRSVTFDLMVDREVEAAIAEGRPVQNLYALTPPVALAVRGAAGAAAGPSGAAAGANEPEEQLEERPFEEVLEEQVARAMYAQGSAYDSHPPPADRIEALERLEGLPREEEDDRLALSLLESREALEGAMTAEINDRVQLALAQQAAYEAELAAQAG